MNTTNQIKVCQNCQQNFTIKDEELVLYKKVGIELPSVCFFCRLKSHLSFWLFGKFRKGTSDLTGESFITVFPNKSRYPIYKLSEWHSDKWDPMVYGKDYDASRPFFEQLKELQEKVPRPHQNGSKNTGCDWCEDVWSSKNCYLSRAMVDSEDLYYSYRNISVKNSIDSVIGYFCEKTYDCADCHNSYKLFYSTHSRDCINSSFLFDCRNCQNCFMSWNLRNKQYCIENVQYTKEEYENKLKHINLGSHSELTKLKKRFEELIKKEVVHRPNFNLKTHNSTGDYLLDTKDCHNCFTISGSEECQNCIRGMHQKSNIDITDSWETELMGNCANCFESYGLKYSNWSSSRYSEYIDLCTECENCFGCVGLKNKKYCILNKQYSKEEYEKLREKIVSDMKIRGDYGKFFPYNMSEPFNLSTGILYFPETTKEDVLRWGGYWEEVDESHIEGKPTSELPDSINDVKDEIITQALICPTTGWRFNIAQNELNFYRENKIPLPREHFDVRIKNRLKYLTVLQSYPYKCTYCKKDIMAYYPPEWGYKKVACEDCYKQNIA